MPWSAKQLKLFRAAAHNPAIAKSTGIKQSDAERMSKEGLKKSAGGSIKKSFNNPHPAHRWPMDIPDASLGKFAGKKGGGLMGKKRFDEGGEVDMDGYEKSGEGEDAVYRKSFSGGVKANSNGDVEVGESSPLPKPKAKPKVKDSPETRAIASRYLNKVSSKSEAPKKTLREKMASGELSGRRMFKSGGSVDGCAQRGKTKGRYI